MNKQQAEKAVLRAAKNAGLKADDNASLAAEIMRLRSQYLALENEMSRLHQRAVRAGIPEAQEGMKKAMQVGLQIVPILYVASQALVGKQRTSRLRGQQE